MNREAEVELARQLLTGNPQAPDWHLEHFRAKIVQYSWRMRGHRQGAEEVTPKKWRKSIFASAHEVSLEQFLPARKEADGGGEAAPASRAPRVTYDFG